MKNKSQFQIFQKEISFKEEATDDTSELYISGIANSGESDLSNETLSAEALESIKEQALNHNLHIGHDWSIDGIIGTITNAEIVENGLRITAKILSKFKNRIKNYLEEGVKFGLSVSGVAEFDDTEKGLIRDWRLIEISLTPVPCDQNTMGTVILGKSFADIINNTYISKSADEKENKNNEKTMENKKMADEPITADEVIELINEAFAEKQEEYLETIRNEIKDEFNAMIAELTKRVETLESKLGENQGESEGGVSPEEEEKAEEEDKPEDEGGKPTDDEDEDKKEFIKSIIKETFKEIKNNSLAEKKHFKYNPEPEIKKDKKKFTPEELAKIL